MEIWAINLILDIFKRKPICSILQTELLKVKNTTEIKKSINRLNSKLETTKISHRFLNKNS